MCMVKYVQFELWRGETCGTSWRGTLLPVCPREGTWLAVFWEDGRGRGALPHTWETVFCEYTAGLRYTQNPLRLRGGSGVGCLA